MHLQREVRQALLEKDPTKYLVTNKHLTSSSLSFVEGEATEDRWSPRSPKLMKTLRDLAQRMLLLSLHLHQVFSNIIYTETMAGLEDLRSHFIRTLKTIKGKVES